MIVKRLLIFSFLAIFSSLAFSQSTDTTRSFRVDHYSDNIKFISYVNGQKVTIKSDFDDDKAKISENNLVLLRDTLKVHSFSNQFEIKDIVMLDKPTILTIENPAYEGYESDYSMLDLTNGMFLPIDLEGYVLTYFDSTLIWGKFQMAKYDGYGDYISQLQQFSLENQKSSKLLDLESSPAEAEGIVGVYPFKKNNSLIIKQAYCYTSLTGCDNSRSYVFNEKNRATTENTDDFLVDEPTLNYPELSGDYYLVKVKRCLFLYSSSGTLDTVLNKQFEVKGWNYENGKVDSYSVLSSLDDKTYISGKKLKRVIIPYKLSYLLEISLYNIFHNNIIESELLKGLDFADLLILKNMVFAKHNYAFSSNFYQAYFNLFAFYDDEEKRASRTKDINGLLTEADIKNLEVINKALRKYD